MNSNIIDILNELKGLKAELYTDKGELKIKLGKGKLTPDLASLIRANKDELIRFLADKSNRTNVVRIPVIPDAPNYALSNAQRRLWILNQIEENSGAYNMPYQTNLNGDYNTELLVKSIHAVIERHQILRTIFKEDEYGEIKQWILPRKELNFEIDVLDYSEDPNSNIKAVHYYQQDAFKPFNLSEGPLIRSAFIKIDESEYFFYFNIHHIIGDEWSAQIFERDLILFYQALVNGESPNLPELEIQYKDYAAWQLEQIKSKRFVELENYWINTLAGTHSLADLPSNKKRPNPMTNNGQNFSTYISKENTAKLRTFCRNNDGSLFSALLAIWNVLIHKYTGKTDIVIGTPVSGRIHHELENQIGFYVNTLALRNSISPNDNSFTEFYKKVASNVLEATNFQEYPFDILVEKLNLERDMSRNPVFDQMLNLQNKNQEVVNIDLSDKELKTIKNNGFRGAKFDMDILFGEIGEYLKFQIDFNTDVYEGEMIKDLMLNFKTLMLNLLENPSQKIAEIELLSSLEKERLMTNLKGAYVSTIPDNTFINHFEETVEKYGDNIAILFEDRELTYKELNNQVNRVANYLIDQNPMEGDLAVLFMERGIKYLIAMIGVLKAKMAFIPLDPKVASERNMEIINNANPLFIISDITQFKEDPNRAELAQKILILEEILEKSHNISNLKRRPKGSNLAYIIYTSGSTGQPKGAMVEHKGMINHLLAKVNDFSITSDDIIAQNATQTFDVNVWQYLTALVVGGKTAVLINDDAWEPHSMFNCVDKYGISILESVPSHFSVVLDHLKQQKVCPLLPTLNYFIMNGEGLPITYCENWFSLYPNKKIANVYGPTECSDDITHFIFEQCNENWIGYVPIGRPIQNMNLYILDENLKMVAKGVSGELYVSGTGVGRGYLGNNIQTEETFLKNPYESHDQHNVLYKTGDLVRLLTDGNIQFLGRKDNQVKIRGNRIELGEIEHHLLELNGISGALVIASEIYPNNYNLIAYYISERTFSNTELRIALDKKLPAYMIPSFFVGLKTFPLTSNGKINRKELPNPYFEEGSSQIEFIHPVTDNEKALVEACKKILRKSSINLNDSFYRLGGDSIKSIQLVSTLKNEGYSLNIQDALRTPILRELALLITGNVVVDYQGEISGITPLLPIQTSFFSDQAIQIKEHYNQSIFLKSNERINRDILEKSLKTLINHHDALRMEFKVNSEGIWSQTNRRVSDVNLEIECHDLTSNSEPEILMKTISEKFQASFKFDQGLLFKVIVFNLKDGDRLGIIAHHLIVDGVSWRIILQDLIKLYTTSNNHQISELPLKTSSFQKWSSAITEYGLNGGFNKELDYWKQFENFSFSKLSHKSDSESSLNEESLKLSFKLDFNHTDLLQTAANKPFNTETNDILLTALAKSFQEIFHQSEVLVQMEGHGRESLFPGIDLTRTIGWFTSVFPFLLKTSEKMSGFENLIRIKEDLRKIPQKGIGYGVLKCISQDLSDNLNPQIEFNYLGNFDGTLEDNKVAKFEFAQEDFGRSTSPKNKSNVPLEIIAFIESNKLTVNLIEHSGKFNERIISDLLVAFELNLIKLISDLSSHTETAQTPSDFTYKNMSLEEVELLEKGVIKDIYRLSPLQEGIYYHYLVSDDASLYFEQFSYRLSAYNLSEEILAESFDSLINRHDVLRTRFYNETGHALLQIVHHRAASNFKYAKIDTDEDNIESAILIEKQKDKTQGFDLSSPSQMRLTVLSLGNSSYEFIWSFHHIIMDGWCVGILINEFYEILRSLQVESPLNLRAPIPYVNYIKWLESVDQNDSKEFWKEYLKGYSATTSVPFKQTKEDQLSEFQYAVQEVEITEDLFKELTEFCQNLEITQSTLVHSVWGYLLSIYNGVNDVVFGSVVSGRPTELNDVEEVVGLFINTIPVRVKFDRTTTQNELLSNVQDAFLSSAKHHFMSLADVQTQSESGVNLIDHIVVVENYPIKDVITNNLNEFDSNQLEVNIESFEVFERTNYDFNLFCFPLENKLKLEFRYDGNKYEAQGIINLKNHFIRILMEFIKPYPIELIKINCIPDVEREQLDKFSQIDPNVGEKETLVDMFEAQKNMRYNEVALISQGKSYTFHSIDAATNQLGSFLIQDLNLLIESNIGIYQSRTANAIISMLAILKSGGAYLPLDITAPLSRIEYLIDDAHIETIITESNLLENVLLLFDQNETLKHVVCIDKDFDTGKKDYLFGKSEISAHPTNQLPKMVRPEHLAYTIYTSGSTGNPKGVMVEHKNVASFIRSLDQNFGFDQINSMAATTNFSFDISVLEIFGSLCMGKKMCLFSDDELMDPNLFLAQLEKEKIESLQLTPSRLALLGEAFFDEMNQDLKLILVGGEALSVDLYQNLKRRDRLRAFNVYGPTETTIWSTALNINESNALSIGRPLRYESVLILNKNERPVPIGVQGELWIGGAGVTRGYLNRAELTEEKFKSIAPIRTSKMYNSGDIVRWTFDGNIEYIGRSDDQVKIRGHRIELREIEEALYQHNGINQVIVLAKNNNTINTTLVAFYKGDEEIETDHLTSFLREKILNVMIPTYFVKVEDFPLLTSGKINRKKLLEITDLTNLNRNFYIAPEGATESTLVEMWQNILNIDKVGVTDNFFSIGGHSINLVQLLGRINKHFEIKFKLESAFDDPTIRRIAHEIELLKVVSVNKEDFVDEDHIRISI